VVWTKYHILQHIHIVGCLSIFNNRHPKFIFCCSFCPSRSMFPASHKGESVWSRSGTVWQTSCWSTALPKERRRIV